MSFEPKLFGPNGGERPDLDSGELDAAPLPNDWQLPAELQQLGDQLRLDARKLAAQYPATHVSSASAAPGDLAPVGVARSNVTAAGNHSPAGRWTTIVSGLLASGLVLAALGTAGRVLDGRRTASPIARETVSSAASPAVTSEPARDSARDSKVARANPDAGSTGEGNPGPGVEAVTPVMFLQELSGPELEGLLDLLEEDSGASRNISI